jgi:subtilisin family serine protease
MEGQSMWERNRHPARQARRHGTTVLAMLIVSGCGGGGGTNSAPPPLAAPAPSPTPIPTPSPTTTFDTAEYRRSDGPGIHNAIPAWQLGATGRGVGIGIVDSGIDTTNPEFTGRISPASVDVTGTRSINDEQGHGTMVALIAGAARNGSGILGMAWESTIVAMRADQPGTCTPADGCSYRDTDIARGIDLAVQGGAKVINLSLGGSAPGASVSNAVTRAAGAGVVVVVSAGNAFNDAQPASDPNNPEPFAMALRSAGNGNVIIAGSVGSNGTISAFSNRAGTEAASYLTALGEQICCI